MTTGQWQLPEKQKHTDCLNKAISSIKSVNNLDLGLMPKTKETGFFAVFTWYNSYVPAFFRTGKMPVPQRVNFLWGVGVGHLRILKNRQDACATKSQLFVGSSGWASSPQHS
jgi:hypothetical protein